MYDKKKIDLLFEQYVRSGDNKTFEQLIETCDSMVDIVLTKYGKYSRHFQDVRQEIKLRMWKNLRNPKKLAHNIVSPSTYLFFVVRAYVVKIFESLMRIYDDDIEMTGILAKSQAYNLDIARAGFLEPESQCAAYELVQEFFRKFVEEVKREESFRESSKRIQGYIMRKYKAEAEADFGVKLDN